MDFLQFILGTVPESLIMQIGDICLVLINCKLKKTRKEVSTKAEEILTFIKTVLMADCVLPHFVQALDALFGQTGEKKLLGARMQVAAEFL